MKVLLVNGSSKKEGCTYTALKAVQEGLESQGIESDIFFIGNEPMSDCIACKKCRETGKCTIDDKVNEFVELSKQYDGFVFGTPVYYAHPSGRLLTFMDRVFYSGGANFAFKPAAAIASARRAGTTATMDVINKYFSISKMQIVSSTYWNAVHGNTPEDVLKDLEGIETMRNIGKNMAWLLKCIEAGREKGIETPENVKLLTNFISQ